MEKFIKYFVLEYKKEKRKIAFTSKGLYATGWVISIEDQSCVIKIDPKYTGLNVDLEVRWVCPFDSLEIHRPTEKD